MGIITNYLSWRIVWLPDCDSLARFPGEDIIPVPIFPTSGCRMPRNLCGTEEISYDDPALPHYLVSLFRKSSHSQALPRGTLNAAKEYIEISPDSSHWLCSDLRKLALQFPHGNVRTFFLRSSRLQVRATVEFGWLVRVALEIFAL